MSADEPRIAKYGLPADESQRFHANHFVVTQERALFRELHFQHALRVGPDLRAALDEVQAAGTAPVTEPPAPATAPEPAPSVPTPRVARRAVPDGLRERLGLR